MPLIKKPTKKAFEHNIKAEMDAGKPQDQSLAIAYDVRHRAGKKKMAKGGKVKESVDTRMNWPQRKGQPRGPAVGVHGEYDQTGRSMAGLVHESGDVEEAKQMHHKKLEESRKQPKPKLYAKGGEVDVKFKNSSLPLDHEALDAYDKEERRKLQEEYGGDKDKYFNGEREKRLKSRVKRLFEGGKVSDDIPEHEGDEHLENGQVDLDDNGRELPNSYYHANEHRALDANIDEDIMDMDQPHDSNLIEPEHDKEDIHDNSIVGAIRRKMKKMIG